MCDCEYREYQAESFYEHEFCTDNWVLVFDDGRTEVVFPKEGIFGGEFNPKMKILTMPSAFEYAGTASAEI